MGIDIYTRQPGHWLASHGGHVGYLREAYHGGPYVTQFLVSEALEAENGEAIPASTLRKRLDGARQMAGDRERSVYGETSTSEITRVLDNYTAFVEYCEPIEHLTGEPVRIIASF